MKKSPFMKLINLLCIYIVLYVVLFCALLLLPKNADDLIIEIAPSPSKLDSRTVSITNPKILDSYYLLIYEDSPDENWLYFNTSSLSTLPLNILDMFLPEEQPNYLLLNGSEQKNQFTFNITAKYPLTYMASKEHLFHVYYIIPFKIFPFPTFYYSKYYTFFVDPLI